MTDVQPGQGSHFWFMSIQVQAQDRVAQLYFQGTQTPQPGATRQDVFNEILRRLPQLSPHVSEGAPLVVLAFDLQPNAL